MEEPLAQILSLVTKKYVLELSKSLIHLSIDRYHYVLVLIDKHQENLSQKALSEILGIDKSYMVNILDYLGENGYILREKNPNDRREQLIKLTLKSRNDLPIIREAIEKLNNRLLKNIDEADKRIFQKVIKSIQDNLTDYAPSRID